MQARITPKQATLFFVDKLTQLSFHPDQKLGSEDLSPSQCFIVAQDQAYFKCVFFSGDRPGDFGRVNDDGFLFNNVWGKTLRDGHENVLGIRRNPQLAICPIKEIEQYMLVARNLTIDLTTVYLFCPTNHCGFPLFLSNPRSSS